MKNHVTTFLRGVGRRALLPAIAALALFAALPAAQADQQVTNAQIDNALNWHAAGGTGASDAYAQASHRDRVEVRSHAHRHR
jgi:predicted secreted protein